MAMSVSVCSMASHADAMLQIGENVAVTEIDGQRISNGIFSDPINRFELNAGRHVIVARYSNLFELSSDEHDVLRSMDIPIEVHLVDGQSYQLVMADQPKNYDAAVKYVKQPTLSLMNQGKLVTRKTAVIGQHRGMLAGVGKSLGTIFTDSGRSPNNAVKIVSTPASSMPVTTTAINAATTSAPSRLDSFMRLWLEASPDERAKIKGWVADQ